MTVAMYTLTEAFAYIVQCLKDTIAPRREMAKSRMEFLSFLWLHLHRLNNRFAALYARWKNGTLPKPRPLPASGAPRPARVRAPRPAPPIRLPSGRLWLLKDTQRAAVAGSLLRHWIATNPELQEFMQAVPQVRSLLQPLCHALGIDIDKPYGVPVVVVKTEPVVERDAPPSVPPAPPTAGLQPELSANPPSGPSAAPPPVRLPVAAT
jgi:hypothetical protein